MQPLLNAVLAVILDLPAFPSLFSMHYDATMQPDESLWLK